MQITKQYQLDPDQRVAFSNKTDYCIGTGRMGLALQKEYQLQLKLVQDKIGFQHIRGHGIFSDDMAIYQVYTDSEGIPHVEYNFTYLDLVIDNYREVGIKPFLELGFMPEKLASDTQTVFYWKGNVTPPNNISEWCRLVQATLIHLMERYSKEEVVTWPIEVWNEPNLTGFWKNADMDAYFALFEETFHAIKTVDKRFQVGGPAICGVDDERWMREFLKFCESRQIALDFVTRHHYTSELPQTKGHYSYTSLRDPEEGLAMLKQTRAIVDEFPAFQGHDIHITEFNTSYVPNAPIHDTNYHAAYMAYLLSRLGDDNASYSYWTFGDIFEEFGVPFTPFHGGFGLVANGQIPKPTFWTFQFFKQLQGKCIHCSNESIVTLCKDGTYQGIAWNLVREAQPSDLILNLQFPIKENGEHCLITHTVDEVVCNPLKLWHDLGEPTSLSHSQCDLLQQAANPFVQSTRQTIQNNILQIDLSLRTQAVVFFELRKVSANSDRGYCYDDVMEMR